MKSYKNLFIIVLLSLPFLFCNITSNTSYKMGKIKVVLIFCDVTNSLVPVECKEVANIAATILDYLPVRTKYALYPIQIETQRLTPIIKAEVPLLHSDTERQTYEAVKLERRREISSKIDTLYKITNSISEDNRTCILNTLKFAENYFSQFDTSRHDLELIYISDMIEECNNNPLKTQVEMDKHDISNEIDLANNFPLHLALSHTRISIIIPTTKETYQVSQQCRPNLDDVEKFWKIILKFCGFKDEQFKSRERFYFGSEFPERLKFARRR
ncbi:hypothetical protein JXJ21_00825 [candidate division KSB1 bacterium]|nr:hypothetical protein [candidate division KSB1 bacterium]